MECYACTNQAVRQCRRCARVYCEVHGGDLCAECMSPASALPSFNLYRGSLLALLIGTAAALWLLVQPPGTGGDSRQVQLPVTPSAAATEPAETPERTPLRSATAPRTGTPALPTPPPATATPAVREYIVQAGDTLLGIAERLAPAGVSPFDYASQIAAASGLASVDATIAPGQRLVLP
jgi:LysM repeat protein